MLVEALEAAAITLLWVRGSVFKPLRERGPKLWQELASCSLCFGVWVGWLGHLAHAGIHDLSLWKVIVAGAVSGVSAMVCEIVLKTVDELGYLADQVSRGLRQDRSAARRLQRQQRELLREASEPCSEHKCPKSVCQAYHPGGKYAV